MDIVGPYGIALMTERMRRHLPSYIGFDLHCGGSLVEKMFWIGNYLAEMTIPVSAIIILSLALSTNIAADIDC